MKWTVNEDRYNSMKMDFFFEWERSKKPTVVFVIHKILRMRTCLLFWWVYFVHHIKSYYFHFQKYFPIFSFFFFSIQIRTLILFFCAHGQTFGLCYTDMYIPMCSRSRAVVEIFITRSNAFNYNNILSEQNKSIYSGSSRQWRSGFMKLIIIIILKFTFCRAIIQKWVPFYFISFHLILLLQREHCQRDRENILLVKLNVNLNIIKYSRQYSELILGFGVIFQTCRTIRVLIFIECA